MKEKLSITTKQGVNRIVQEIRTFAEAHRNPAVVAKYQRYFKEGYKAYGLEHQQLTEILSLVLDREEASFPDYWPLCRVLSSGSMYEEPGFAIGLFLSFKKEFSKASFLEIDHWFDIGIINWAHSDMICSELIKPHWKKGIIGSSDFSDWRFSPRPYKRRASLVSHISPMKDGLPVAVVLDFAEALMTDTERVVHQGAGWLLRETWKKHPGEVEAFLLKWKDTSARLIFQYATEKMSPEQKDRFRRSKKNSLP